LFVVDLAGSNSNSNASTGIEIIPLQATDGASTVHSCVLAWNRGACRQPRADIGGCGVV